MFQVMAETAVKVYYGNLMMLPDVARVLACLNEKDVRFELVNMNKGAKKQLLPMDFFKLQEKALNRVPGPAFEDGSKVLFESRAICRHLSDKYSQQGNAALLGRDPLERASIEQWLRSEEHSFDPPSWTLFFHLAVAPYDVDNREPDCRDLIQESERKLSEVLDVYNQRLGDSKYLAGNDFSMADLSHLPNSHYLANSKDWSYLFSSRKHVRKWWKKISERSSWVKTVRMIDQLPVLHGKLASSSSTKTLVPSPPKHVPNSTPTTPRPSSEIPTEPDNSSSRSRERESAAKPLLEPSKSVPIQKQEAGSPVSEAIGGGNINTGEEKIDQTIKQVSTADATTAPVPTGQQQPTGGKSNTVPGEKSLEKSREKDRSTTSNGGKLPEPPIIPS